MELGHGEAIWWQVLGLGPRKSPALASGRQHAKPERKWGHSL